MSAMVTRKAVAPRALEEVGARDRMERAQAHAGAGVAATRAMASR